MRQTMLMGISMPRKSSREWYDRRFHPIWGGTFHDPQTRWSTIEKEAYAIYWALLRLDDLIGEYHLPYTQTIETSCLYESRKVLQWKLDIQHYDAIIEHVPGKANIPADIFSRQIIRAPTLPLFHIL